MTPKAEFRKQELANLINEISSRICHEIQLATLIPVEEKEMLQSKVHSCAFTSKLYLRNAHQACFEFLLLYYCLWVKISVIDFFLCSFLIGRIQNRAQKSLLARMARAAAKKKARQQKKRAVKEILRELELAIDRECGKS